MHNIIFYDNEYYGNNIWRKQGADTLAYDNSSLRLKQLNLFVPRCVGSHLFFITHTRWLQLFINQQ